MKFKIRLKKRKEYLEARNENDRAKYAKTRYSFDQQFQRDTKHDARAFFIIYTNVGHNLAEKLKESQKKNF